LKIEIYARRWKLCKEARKNSFYYLIKDSRVFEGQTEDFSVYDLVNNVIETKEFVNIDIYNKNNQMTKN
jgi:hypothetical protein